jgi:glycosyltransferase involved in cell wall biosynthesis
LPFSTFPGPEGLIEKMGRAINWPKLDQWAPDADWYYSPMEGRLPVSSGRNATTIHDVQALELDLPWSNTPEHRSFRRKWEFWVPKALRTVDRILTVSEFSKQRMIDCLGADPDQIVVIGNAVDEVFFKAGDQLIGKVEKAPEIVIVGGLRYKKGADWVFDVADLLHQRGSKLKIVAIGQHDPQYVARAEAHPKVESLGMIPDADLVARLAGATAQMLLSHYEGFGIPALEAMACGTPAVVSDRASLPEVVADAGFIVNPEVTGDVADVLESLDPTSSAYVGLVQRGRLHAHNYTWDHCTDRVLEVFRSER